jgi:hypothetical protein
MTMQAGDLVTYVGGKKVRFGVVTTVLRGRLKGQVEVQLESDPFPVPLSRKDLLMGRILSATVNNPQTEPEGSHTMAAKKTPAQRRAAIQDLKNTAQRLEIAGYTDMSIAELKAAVAAAKTSAPPTKKAAKSAKATKKLAPRPKVSKEQAEKVRPPSKSAAAAEEPTKPAKASAKKTAKTTAKAKPAKAEAVEDGAVANPFRKGSDRAFIFNLLVRGGNRQKMAERAASKLNLRPYSADAGEPTLLDYDKRLTLVATVLRDEHGFDILKTGRGLGGTLKVTPPASSAKAKPSKKAAKRTAA